MKLSSKKRLKKGAIPLRRGEWLSTVKVQQTGWGEQNYLKKLPLFLKVLESGTVER